MACEGSLAESLGCADDHLVVGLALGVHALALNVEALYCLTPLRCRVIPLVHSEGFWVADVSEGDGGPCGSSSPDADVLDPVCALDVVVAEKLGVICQLHVLVAQHQAIQGFKAWSKV